MEVEYLQSEDLRPLRRVDMNALPVEEEAKVELLIWQARSETLDAVQRATGQEFRVTMSGVPNYVGGFYDGTDKKVYLSDWVLDKPKLALHVAKHETNHKMTDITSLNFREWLAPMQIDVLEQKLKIPDIDAIDWVEAFNEMITFEQNGVNDNSAYAKEFVPAAQKLEQLALKTIGVSLKEAFIYGDTVQFAERLTLLSTRLLARTTFNRIMPRFDEQFTAHSKKFGINAKILKRSVLDAFEKLAFDFKDINDVEMALEKLSSETLQRMLLQKLIPRGYSLEVANEVSLYLFLQAKKSGDAVANDVYTLVA